MNARGLLLGLVCLSASFAHVRGHGYLLQPEARNWVAHKQGRFWNEASGNGLGQGNTQGPGVCGDPFQTTNSNFINEPSPVQATYKEGSVIELKVILTTNHGGKFSFRVCPRRRDLDAACFGSNYLTRVDNGQRDYWIFDIAAEHTMRYKLPAGITCEAGCVLQWEYYSMQSCIEPGCDRKYCGGYADGDNVLYNSNPGFCGRTGAQAEFFRNCADIRILPAGARDMGSGSGSPEGVENADAAQDVHGMNVKEVAAVAAADTAVDADVSGSGGLDATGSSNGAEIISIAPAVHPEP